MWILKKISVVKECETIEVDGFMNYGFKAVIGSNNQEFNFSFVDLPLMNLHAWIVLFNISSKEKMRYENQLQHLENTIRSNCMVLCKMDVEVASIV